MLTCWSTSRTAVWVGVMGTGLEGGVKKEARERDGKKGRWKEGKRKEKCCLISSLNNAVSFFPTRWCSWCECNRDTQTAGGETERGKVCFCNRNLCPYVLDNYQQCTTYCSLCIKVKCFFILRRLEAQRRKERNEAHLYMTIEVQYTGILRH